MPRVIGIDAGTVSLDLVGLDDGRVFVERSVPTRDALADPDGFVRSLDKLAPLDLVVAPSGYGLPLTRAAALGEAELALAFLSARGDTGGIGGIKALLRALARSPLPVVLTPAVVHLPTVPAHRKLNRIDMGTADKVCAVVHAVHGICAARGCPPEEVSFTLLELGGAFTAAIAVEHGQIVDGIGGSSGPIGARSSGALDAEVAFLAGHVTKEMVFSGGAEAIGPAGWEAYREHVLKALAALGVSAPAAREVVLSGRHADHVTGVLSQRRIVSDVARGAAKQGAHGAALMADGLTGGTAAPVVERLAIREAFGSVLDHLHVITPASARARLGIG